MVFLGASHQGQVKIGLWASALWRAAGRWGMDQHTVLTRQARSVFRASHVNQAQGLITAARQAWRVVVGLLGGDLSATSGAVTCGTKGRSCEL